MKKALSWLLALAMMVGMVPQTVVSASAAEHVDSESCGHVYKNGVCAGCGNSVLELGYTHAIPESQGVENIS